MTDTGLQELGAHIASAFALSVQSIDVAFGELTLTVEAQTIPKLAAFLKDNELCRFETLVDICGADYPGRPKRFEVVYHFLSMRRNQRIRVKLQAGEGETVPSLCDVFPAANWFEREAFDMYGILFAGHPDLRRILTDYGFDGFPLRKDFPLTGYVEVRYDDELKRVVYEPVKLQQEYRNFDYLSPWEGARSVLPGDEKAGAK